MKKIDKIFIEQSDWQKPQKRRLRLLFLNTEIKQNAEVWKGLGGQESLEVPGYLGVK